jgi:type II secretion system protein G
MGKQSGFTLLELLVVVVIIGIIAAVAIPNFAGAQDKAKNSGVQANCHSLQLAIEAYRVDHGDSYPANLSQVSTDTNYVRSTGLPPTPWKTQQASNQANLPCPPQGYAQTIAAGAMVPPTDSTHYGGICYTMSGTANEKYVLDGVGKSANNALHVFHTQNF